MIFLTFQSQDWKVQLLQFAINIMVLLQLFVDQVGKLITQLIYEGL
jgi:hypothetical protein